jgi:transcriptional regulator GlxA family with amidase domain
MACRWLDRRPNDARIHAFAIDQGVSDRHLRRLFAAQLGFGAAHYVRLRRFVRALHLISSARTLSDVAHAAHYADQPHLCREFRAIAGLSPGEYRSRRSFVPGHLFD